MNDRQRNPSAMLTILFIGIIIWAGLIAAGVFRQSGGDWAKTSIVIGVAAVFLGGWFYVLRRRG